MKNNFYLFFKKLLDIILSFLGCVIVVIITPIIKLIYIYYKDYDKIFYKQIRIGKDNKKFYLYKYRTMNINADKDLIKILNNKKIKKEWDDNQKIKNDPRITKFGKILRNTCIDEFPQFINVLKGNMSIVGPRPYLLREKKFLKKDIKTITKVKPGITGYWQINKATQESFKERIICDKYYLENYGVVMDFKISINTLKILIKNFCKLIKC